MKTQPPISQPPFRAAIAERITTRQTTLAAAARHLLDTPGKGLRPTCARLVGAAFAPNGQTDERHEALAEAIELIHVGSLIHDDILDEADTRRGTTAVHVHWDAKVAVLAGDYLLARATQLVAGLHDPELTTRLGQVVADLCEGELLQDEQLYDLEVGIDRYLERVAKKAASPFELACEGAARISGARGREAAAARAMGFHVGRLLQLVDDWLDWHAASDELGKPAGRDLLAGTLTLPVLVVLAHPDFGPRARALLTPFPEHEVPPALVALVGHAEPKREVARTILDEAARAERWLLELPTGPARNELAGMLEALVARTDVRAHAGRMEETSR